MTIRCRLLVLALVATATLTAPGEALAQTPRLAPQARFRFLDERTLGPFVLQRWVREAAPNVSPEGICECITVVYVGGRRVLRVGYGEPARTTVTEPSGRDINGDGSMELVVSGWTGGTHCCFSTTVYSMESQPRRILSVSTGTCESTFEDLDRDGRLEFVTCDDRWANEYCSFDDSPFPRVVFFYDTAAREYRPATPQYAGHYREQMASALDEAQKWLLENGGENAGLDKCRLLAPVLGLMYAGRLNDGLFLLRSLYNNPDVDAFTQETVTRVQASPLWVGAGEPGRLTGLPE